MKLSIQIEFDKILDLRTKKTSVIAGRSPDCDLVIPHQGVSRRHCKIELEGDKFFITDLGSANGVSIDSERIPAEIRTFILPSSQLNLGTLECTLSLSGDDQDQDEDGKIMASSDHGEHTSTLRLARLDISRQIKRSPVKSYQNTKTVRNPIAGSVKSSTKETLAARPSRYNYVALLVIALAAIFHLTNDLLSRSQISP
jgi:predicted component of type VI protein secretion system